MLVWSFVVWEDSLGTAVVVVEVDVAVLVVVGGEVVVVVGGGVVVDVVVVELDFVDVVGDKVEVEEVDVEVEELDVEVEGRVEVTVVVTVVVGDEETVATAVVMLAVVEVDRSDDCNQSGRGSSRLGGCRVSPLITTKSCPLRRAKASVAAIWGVHASSAVLAKVKPCVPVLAVSFGC